MLGKNEVVEPMAEELSAECGNLQNMISFMLVATQINTR